jgi:hypothetical protein
VTAGEVRNEQAKGAALSFSVAELVEQQIAAGKQRSELELLRRKLEAGAPLAGDQQRTSSAVSRAHRVDARDGVARRDGQQARRRGRRDSERAEGVAALEGGLRAERAAVGAGADDGAKPCETGSVNWVAEGTRAYVQGVRADRRGGAPRSTRPVAASSPLKVYGIVAVLQRTTLADAAAETGRSRSKDCRIGASARGRGWYALDHHGREQAVCRCPARHRTHERGRAHARHDPGARVSSRYVSSCSAAETPRSSGSDGRGGSGPARRSGLPADVRLHDLQGRTVARDRAVA